MTHHTTNRLGTVISGELGLYYACQRPYGVALSPHLDTTTTPRSPFFFPPHHFETAFFLLPLHCISSPTLYWLLLSAAVSDNFTATIPTHTQLGSSEAPRAGDREREGGGRIQRNSMVGCTGTMKASAEGEKAGGEVCAAAEVQEGKHDNEI